MRAMLNWSYDLLPDEIKDIFCKLAVFPESFTAAEAESVCTIRNIHTSLTSLIDQSLLEQTPCENGEPRFKMLGIIREFASEKGNKPFINR
jgi:hypothetical protein